MKQLLLEAIEDIKPSKEYEEDILGKANSIINKINKGIKDAKAILGGSGAKGTWLKTFDADITVTYTSGAGTLAKVSTGTISGKINA